MSQRTRRPLTVLVAYDLRQSLASTRGLLVVGFLALVWGWFLWKLGEGYAEKLTDDRIRALVAFFSGGMSRLLQERPATLSVYFAVTLTLMPCFAIIASCNQTASDLASKHLRFLMPRVGRAQIYVARFLAAAIVVGGAQILGAMGATFVQVQLHTAPPAQVVAFGAQVALVLVVYSLAFVAMMALVSTWTASSRLSLIAGLGGYLAVLIVVLVLTRLWQPFEHLGYVLPSAFKSDLLQPDLAGALKALCGVAAYVGVYLFAGWKLFAVRDA